MPSIYRSAIAGRTRTRGRENSSDVSQQPDRSSGFPVDMRPPVPAAPSSARDFTDQHELSEYLRPLTLQHWGHVVPNEEYHDEERAGQYDHAASPASSPATPQARLVIGRAWTHSSALDTSDAISTLSQYDSQSDDEADDPEDSDYGPPDDLTINDSDSSDSDESDEEFPFDLNIHEHAYVTHLWSTSPEESPADAVINIYNDPFPSTTIPLIRGSGEGGDNDTSCPICLEDYKAGEVMAVVPCRSMHRFHVECIREWHNNQEKKGPEDGFLTCPFCRGKLFVQEAIVAAPA